jgi:hypothetical protein
MRSANLRDITAMAVSSCANAIVRSVLYNPRPTEEWV